MRENATHEWHGICALKVWYVVLHVGKCVDMVRFFGVVSVMLLASCAQSWERSRLWGLIVC